MAVVGAGIAWATARGMEIDILARTIWGEARGQGVEGMAAVAAVILNRVRDPRWPNTVRGVILQPKQFSMWTAGDPNGAQAMKAGPETPMFPEALAVAAAALSGALDDPTGGANHYATAAAARRVSWDDAMVKLGAIGNHIFWRG